MLDTLTGKIVAIVSTFVMATTAAFSSFFISKSNIITPVMPSSLVKVAAVATPPSLTFSGDIAVQRGVEFDLPISLNNTSGARIRAVDVNISFDPSKIELLSIVPNAELKSNLAKFLPSTSDIGVGQFDPVKVIANAISIGSAEKMIQFSAVAYNPINGNYSAVQSESINPLATLRFKALQIGKTSILFNKVSGSSKDTNIISDTLPPTDLLDQSGNLNPVLVTIFEASPTPTPVIVSTVTATSVPTRTPTTRPTASLTPAIPTPSITNVTSITRVPTLSPSSTPTPSTIPDGNLITKTFIVNGGSNDVNMDDSQYASQSNTVWLGNGASKTSSFTGLRFTNVDIPSGAQIVSAKLKVVPQQDAWVTMRFGIFGNLLPDSPPFTIKDSPATRKLTTSSASHQSNVLWKKDTSIEVANVSSVVQEIVNQPTWNSNNSFSLILKGTGTSWGRKFVYSAESSTTLAPKIEIQYKVLGNNQ